MAKFRKKPVVVEAERWFKNGDHSEDYSEERPFMENGVFTMKPGSYFKEHDFEGGVVRYFRRPDLPGETICHHCSLIMHDHGWIDTLEGGHIVCPGDWVITGTAGERYPCKPQIFETIYEAIH